MATGNFLIYATIGGQSSVISRFGLDEEEKALAYAKQVFGEGKASAVRVTVEVADPATGRKTTNTVVVHRREDTPKPTDSAAAAATQAKPAGGGGKLEGLDDEPQMAAAATGSAAPKPRKIARAAEAGALRPGAGARPGMGGAAALAQPVRLSGSGPLIVKGASAAAAGVVASVVVYFIASHLFGGFASRGTLLGTAGLGFIGGYFWIWRMLMTPEEAAQLRAIFSPARGRAPMGPMMPPPRPRPTPGGTRPAAAEPSATAEAEAPEKPEVEIEFSVKPERLGVLEECDQAVIAYLHASLARVIERGKHLADNRLDPYSTFGCHLFYAGVCEGIGREKRLDQDEVKWLLAKSLSKIAFDPDGSRNFAQNYQEYLAQPKYLEMFKAGIDGIQGDLRGQTPSEPVLVVALERWNEAESKSTRADFVAVLFTDIIGSTAFTQAHGDQAQMELVKAHNEVVRAALTDNAGREIKHTGDGIMAAFNLAHEAVGAAVQIQKAVAQHNAGAKQPELHMRIGINAGEPIAEGSDLFGSTVQLAARVCAEAGTDEIVVSSVVQGLCAGKSVAFENRGKKQLKGFKEPVEVFAVSWR